ncbi:glycoside hydrolase family 9 protein [Paenibacillus farraposensis]|uniref:glycoside hydrolase family 9 protein n=1 Tax=Paenibacillus farraposensis TaxID=2807095 RepID=UPI00361EDB2E
MTNMSANFINSNKAVLDPDGNGSVDVSGGFHDAGDHVKFGLPQSYTASTLGWGFYEFRDAFRQTGQEEHMLEELKWFSDYLLRSTFRDSSGKVIAFNYMVGNGTVDHTYWGPPELQDSAKYPRPATFATAETPASDQAAEAAAALAIMSLNMKNDDAEYASTCLENAKALYRFAQTNRGLGNSDGFYNSSFDEDDLSWAAVWLYAATSDMNYIHDINATGPDGMYTGYMKKSSEVLPIAGKTSGYTVGIPYGAAFS